MMKLGDRVRALRVKHNLTQQNMADKLGMTRQGYGNIELNRSSPPASRLEEIATILHVTPGALFPPRPRLKVPRNGSTAHSEGNICDFVTLSPGEEEPQHVT